MKALHPSKLNLTASILDGETRSLYITAPHAGAGTSTCAFSLASSLGLSNPECNVITDEGMGYALPLNRAGIDNALGFSDLIHSAGRDIQPRRPYSNYTLLIDGSRGCNSLTNKLGLEDQLGLSDLILSDGVGALSKAVHRLSDAPFHFIPSGQQRLGLSMGSARITIKRIIETLKGVYKYVIYDSPHTQNNSESLAIASAFDGVVMVVSGNETRTGVAQAAKDSLVQSGANVIGVIFNRRKYYIPRWLYELL